MASITAQQTALADVLSDAFGGDVRTEPVTSPKALDGWVNIGKVVPGSTMTTCDCTFTAVLILGSDARKAAESLRTLPVAIIAAVTTGALHPSDVSLEPVTLPAGDVAPGELYALVLTLTLEVD